MISLPREGGQFKINADFIDKFKQLLCYTSTKTFCVLLVDQLNRNNGWLIEPQAIAAVISERDDIVKELNSTEMTKTGDSNSKVLSPKERLLRMCICG